MKHTVKIVQELFLLIGSLLTIALVVTFLAVELTSITKSQTMPNLTLAITDPVVYPNDIILTWQTLGFKPNNYEFRYKNSTSGWSSYSALTPTTPTTKIFNNLKVPPGEYQFQLRTNNSLNWLESNIAKTIFLNSPEQNSAKANLKLAINTPVVAPNPLTWTWTFLNIKPTSYEFRYSDDNGMSWSSYVDFTPTTETSDNLKTWPTQGMSNGFYKLQIKATDKSGAWVESNIVPVLIQ
ncbi:hypothetical protein K8R32_02290 [bacterium]|nr:hypothetical protein [bacterium]